MGDDTIFYFEPSKKYKKIIDIFNSEEQGEFWYITKPDERGNSILNYYNEYITEYASEMFGTEGEKLMKEFVYFCNAFIKINKSVTKELLHDFYEESIIDTDGKLFFLVDKVERATYFCDFIYDEDRGMIYFSVQKISPKGQVKDWGGFEKKLREEGAKGKDHNSLNFAYDPKKCNNQIQATLDDFTEEHASEVIIFKNPNQKNDMYDCYLKEELYKYILNKRQYFERNYNTNDVFKVTDMNGRPLTDDEIAYMLSKFDGMNREFLEDLIYKPPGYFPYNSFNDMEYNNDN